MTQPRKTSRAPQPDAARIAGRLGAQLDKLLSEGVSPGLHLVATPIGNLGDISLRAIATLASADAVFCEDTRRTLTLLAHYGIARDVQVYEEHSAERLRQRVMAALEAGKSVALVSDAGTPLISDPGFKLVREAVSTGRAVFSVPGPCAAVAALTVSGLATDRFLFAGFLPPKSSARRQRLRELCNVDASLLFYESAGRLMAALEDMEAVLVGRRVALIREMTKRFEEHLLGTPAELRGRLAERTLKGEIVIVAGPPQAVEVGDALIGQHLDETMLVMSPRDAVKLVADMLGVQRKRVYDIMVRRETRGHES